MAHRTPFGAVFAMVIAALGAGAMAADKKGLGADPVVKTSTKAIGMGGLIWALWAGVAAALGKRR